jgi:hypothetical protein
VLLLVACLPVAADELIAEHVFATAGNINAVTYNSGTPEEVSISCTNGTYGSGAFQVTGGTITSANAQYVSVSIPSPAVTISKIEVSAYTSNTRKTFYQTSTTGSFESSSTQITLSKENATYTVVGSAVSGPLYVRIGGLTGGSGNVLITAVRVYAMPSVPTLALTSAASTAGQTVPENLVIADIVYTYGGTADGYAFEWTAGTADAGTPPAGIAVAANSANRTVTISGTPSAQGVYAYTIRATEAGAPAEATALSGTITVTEPVPALQVTPAVLSTFHYLEGDGGPSDSQTLTLVGVNLTPGEITIAASDNYEVSQDNAAFAASVVLVVAADRLEATPVYVRMAAGLASGSYNGLLSIDGAGLSDPLVLPLPGSVTTPLELVPVTVKTWTTADFVSGSYVGNVDPVFASDKTMRITAGVNEQGQDRTVHINNANNAENQIRMNNSGSIAYCNLAFKVTGPSRITITAESTNDNAKEIAVATAGGIVGTVSAPGRNNAAPLTVRYNGNDAEGVLYIYSNGGGAIDITSVAVEPYNVAIPVVNGTKQVVSETYYTLAGVPAKDANTPGVYIRKTIYSDGSADAVKTIMTQK